MGSDYIVLNNLRDNVPIYVMVHAIDSFGIYKGETFIFLRTDVEGMGIPVKQTPEEIAGLLLQLRLGH